MLLLYQSGFSPAGQTELEVSLVSHYKRIIPSRSGLIFLTFTL